MIDGLCASACTLVLSAVPPDKICVTPRARLGFHAAYDFGSNGRTITNPEATMMLYSMYPTPVQRWISARGGLTPQMLFLRGKAIAGDVPTVRLEVSTVCGSNSRSSLRRVGVRHRRSPKLA